jgi:serine/threonine protein kinase/WD40 repeat protein
MPDLGCLSEDDLRAYLLGDLPARIADLVADHLRACRECEEAARRLDDLTDQVVRTLRRAVGGDETHSALRSVTPTAELTEPHVADTSNRSRDCPAGYELLDELGRGGMSVVYRARQTHPRRIVAVKMILAAAHSTMSRKARFLAEADAIARLRHPNIVGVYEVGEFGGLPYLSLEYVPGGTLADKLVGAPLLPSAAAALVETLARAVQYAHEQGVVHRDLKPSNVLMQLTDGSSPTGSGGAALTPKVADFGLAKQTDVTLTATGDILGTPQYMAPEQADGRQPAGPPADIYALGAILYECLTGRPPFRGASTLDTLAMIRDRDPVAPRVLQPGVSRDLETICLKCLEKHPARRYLTAGDLADDLRRLRAGEPIRARRSSAWERGLKWVRRRPAMAAGIALTTLLAFSGSTAAWLFKEQRDDARAARHDAVEKLRESLVARARSGRTSGRPGRRFDSLAALADAARLRPGDDLRDEVIASLTHMDIRPAHGWKAPPGRVQWIDFDDAFTRYVCPSDDGRSISVRRTADGAEVMQVPGSGGDVWGELSPDGRHLFVTQQAAPRRLWRLESPAPALVFDEPPDHLDWTHGTHGFSSDGRQFAIGGRDGAIHLYELSSGRRVRRLPVEGKITWLAYDPAGRRLAVATDGRATILDAGSGAVLHRLPEDAGPPPSEAIAWHPSGEILAVTDKDLRVRLWDVAGGRAVRILDGRSAGTQITFNHAGDLVATTGWQGQLRICETATGRQVLSVPFKADLRRFSADDRILGGGHHGGQFVLWEIERGREYRTLTRDGVPEYPRGYGRCAVSPDGRWVIAATAEGVAVWDLATGLQKEFAAIGGCTLGGVNTNGAFLANVATGTSWWPMKTVDGSVRVGPPEPVRLPGVFSWTAGTPDGRVVAGVEFDKGVVLHRDRPDRPVLLGPLPDAREVAVSPDGEWVVTCSHWAGGLTVWNARSGDKVAHLRDGYLNRAIFSPDGRFLAGCNSPIDSREYTARVWEVGTWRELSEFAGMPFAFAPGAALLAVETGRGEIELRRPETGAVVARLEDPNLERADYGCFAPDGAALVVTANDGACLHVWDLRLIQASLAERGLDWDAPPYPPAPQRANFSRVEIVGSDNRP